MPSPLSHIKSIGSRAEVMHGTAHHTSGGLVASQLKYSASGSIVSKKASARATREKRLGIYLGASVHNPLIASGKISTKKTLRP